MGLFESDYERGYEEGKETKEKIENNDYGVTDLLNEMGNVMPSTPPEYAKGFNDAMQKSYGNSSGSSLENEVEEVESNDDSYSNDDSSSSHNYYENDEDEEEDYPQKSVASSLGELLVLGGALYFLSKYK